MLPVVGIFGSQCSGGDALLFERFWRLHNIKEELQGAVIGGKGKEHSKVGGKDGSGLLVERVARVWR